MRSKQPVRVSIRRKLAGGKMIEERYKIDRGEVKTGGSDEVGRPREDNAHAARERGEAKWANRD